MELSEFVSKTIQNIQTAIEDSDYMLGTGVPGSLHDGDGVIDFDVLVTVTNVDSSQGGGKVSVVGLFSGGLDKEISKEINHSSRIKFQLKQAHKPTVGKVTYPNNLLNHRNSNR